MYAVIDAETTEIKDFEIPRTKFWGYADENGYKYFKRSKDLAKFLRHEPQRILLHHSNFDVIQLLIDGIDLKILKSHNGKLIKCILGKQILLNSFSVFPLGLGKIFKAFGYEKTSLGELRKRNWEDCVNGLDCFLKLDQLFVDIAGVSPLAMGTIAATGFRAAENTAGKMPKDLRFLSAYRGGRCEVFNLNKANCGNYDIHSSYSESFTEAKAKETLWKVRVKTKDWHGPLFHAANTERLNFPNGDFVSYVFRSNYEKYIEPYAEKTSIKILKKTVIDFQWMTELRGMILKVYDKKEISTGGIELCCKLFLNSLYGRIGLRGESERARILDYEPDADDVTVYNIGKGRYLAFDKVERECRSNFPFAAFITDNARGRLYQAFKRNNPYYGDTDSIFTPFVRKQFGETLSSKLGCWGDKGHREPFQAINVKDYWHGCFACHHTGKQGKKKCLVCKGRKFLSVRKGGDEHTIWTLKQFAKGKTAQKIIRQRKTTLQKRIVLPNGETDPLLVND